MSPQASAVRVPPRLLVAFAVAAAVGALVGRAVGQPAPRAPDFPRELVEWEPFAGNPLFTATGGATWDHEIRERGFILREGGVWKLWYTGYDSRKSETKALGYATSSDGLRFTRDPKNPIFAGVWTEDVCVLHRPDGWFMFAEGKDDIAHQLTSPDGVRWTERGSLDIRTQAGTPLSPGPYGTPTVYVLGDTWYLFYERDDKGVWLATSRDRSVWRNVKDEPVLALGPEEYDRAAIALDQVIRYKGRYYGVYHANADPKWQGPWTTCLAVSDDLVSWRKYEGNPVVRSDDSSGVLVDDGERLRLYTMHPSVKLWLPRGTRLPSAAR